MLQMLLFDLFTVFNTATTIITPVNVNALTTESGTLILTEAGENIIAE